MDKKLVVLAAVIGSSIGSYLPNLWGGDFLSGWSVLLGGVGGLLGIWLAWRLAS